MTSRAGRSAAWTTVHGLTVTGEAAFAGSFGARATATGASDIWARKTLAAPAQDVTTTLRFKVDSRTKTMHMLRLRSAANATLLRVSLNNTGRLLYRNEVAGVNHTSTTTVASNGAWHELSVRAFANGAGGHVTVKLDGVTVPGLDLVENLGAGPIGRVTLGDETKADVYSAAYDNLVVTG